MRRFVDVETGEIITLPQYVPYPDRTVRRLVQPVVVINPVPVVRYSRVRRARPIWPTVVRHVSPIVIWGAIAVGLMLCSR
jgi:hypothetical protein